MAKSACLKNAEKHFSKNSFSHTTVSKMLRVGLFLGMSSGSVPVQWLFSITGLICDGRRSSIRLSKLNKISFLHDSLDYVMSICDK